MPGEARRRRLRALLKLSGAANVDLNAIDIAFVHESAARENAAIGISNERLEFFGDAILGYVAARYLTAKYPAANEGELTRRKAALVSGDACAATARRLGFGELVVLGAGMANAGGADNASVLADAFEAYVAALFGAAGLEVTASFLQAQHLEPHDTVELAAVDAKTALQELTQGRLGLAPVYFERAEGPAHDRRFTSQVRVGDEVLGEGIGSSKKAAQQSAAAMALQALRERIPPEAPAPAASNQPDGRVIDLRSRRKKSPPKAP